MMEIAVAPARAVTLAATPVTQGQVAESLLQPGDEPKQDEHVEEI